MLNILSCLNYNVVLRDFGDSSDVTGIDWTLGDHGFAAFYLESLHGLRRLLVKLISVLIHSCCYSAPL